MDDSKPKKQQKTNKNKHSKHVWNKPQPETTSNNNTHFNQTTKQHMGKTVKRKQQTKHMPQLKTNKQEHTWKPANHNQNTTPIQFKTNKHKEQHKWKTTSDKHKQQQHQSTVDTNKQTNHMRNK